MTTSEELLIIDPLDLKFRFELKKPITSSFELINKTDNHVAFKVKTTNPRKYTVRPNSGIILPRSRSNVTVTMQPQTELPPDMQCKDKFLVQSVITNPGSTTKDINPDMFNKGNHVEECKLKVIYVSPPRKPSPVPEDSEEGTSPTASETDLQGQSEPQDNSTKARDLILRLMEERDSIILQNSKLNRELELLRNGRQEHRTGVPFLYILLVGLLGILLGYIVRNV
ncbi:vesicle-associated protein 1-2-like isoform X2 [Lycium ferocissimum]|uniref:vesicle-associated protein 1-2-like isoform X2 n=1 Tax=Lycium ferocissimum TaxID=112874 RepID=UPI0028155167|nr:vesicle-associated protein 1-2-like isoform X2 [Lycium ferocissimum]